MKRKSLFVVIFDFYGLSEGQVFIAMRKKSSVYIETIWIWKVGLFSLFIFAFHLLQWIVLLFYIMKVSVLILIVDYLSTFNFFNISLYCMHKNPTIQMLFVIIDHVSLFGTLFSQQICFLNLPINILFIIEFPPTFFREHVKN